jgi:histone deacetylase HOS2
MAGSDIPRAQVRDDIVQQWEMRMPDRTGSHSRTPDNAHDHDDGYANGDDYTCDGRPSRNQTPTEDDERHWQDEELNRKIMQQVEDNGITRPKGLKVSYHYNSTVEDMHFGRTHPMKPWRLTLAKHLILGYGLHYAMDTHEALPATKEQVCAFHDPDYVEFLSEVAQISEAPQISESCSSSPRRRQRLPRPIQSLYLSRRRLSSLCGHEHIPLSVHRCYISSQPPAHD